MLCANCIRTRENEKGWNWISIAQGCLFLIRKHLNLISNYKKNLLPGRCTPGMVNCNSCASKKYDFIRKKWQTHAIFIWNAYACVTFVRDVIVVVSECTVVQYISSVRNTCWPGPFVSQINRRVCMLYGGFHRNDIRRISRWIFRILAVCFGSLDGEACEMWD